VRQGLTGRSLSLSTDNPIENRTLAELAHDQNVLPIADIKELFGTWPGELCDGFEEAIDELRHSNSEGINA